MASISSPNLAAFPKAAAGLYARHGQRLPGLVSAILVALFAVVLAQLVWTLIPAPAAAAWRPAPPPPSTARKAEPPDLSVIAAAQMFGHAEPVKTVDAEAKAPDTQLALTLLGIFADGRDPKFSRALIGTAGGDEKPYAIGDDIAHGVTLQMIFPDRVVLSRNGQLETLRLDKDKPNAGGPAVADAADAGASDSNSAASSMQALAQIRSQLLADPGKAQDFIRIQPVNTGNGLHGYRIYPGKNRGLFENAGLKPGDVVTAINGVSLDDPAKSLQLLSDLSQSQQLSVVIDRGGASQTVNLSLTQ